MHSLSVFEMQGSLSDYCQHAQNVAGVNIKPLHEANLSITAATPQRNGTRHGAEVDTHSPV